MSSSTEMTGLAAPAVVAVLAARVPVCAVANASAVGAPMISPAIAAADGSRFANTAPVATAAASGRVRLPTTDLTLSTPGIKSVVSSKPVATSKATSAAVEPSQPNELLSSTPNQPKCAVALNISRGRKVRYPVAADKPSPSRVGSTQVSMAGVYVSPGRSGGRVATTLVAWGDDPAPDVPTHPAHGR